MIALAETITLKSGEILEAEVIEKTNNSIKIDFYGVPLTYYFEDIESIDGQKVSLSRIESRVSHKSFSPKTPEEVFEEYASSVVRIEEREQPFESPSEVGFIVREDGIIVTNFHVFVAYGFQGFHVRLKNGRVYPILSVVGYDFMRDIFIFKINAQNLPAASLGNSDDLKKGNRMIAIIVRQDGKYEFLEGELLEKEKWYDTTILRNNLPGAPGVSGAPVFDRDGKVVGMYKGGHADMKSWRCAIPVNYVKMAIEANKQISLEEFTEIAKNNAYVLREIGEELINHGDFNSAIKFCKEALIRKPDYAEVYTTLCISYLRLKQFDKALAVAKRAAELEPNLAEVQNNLAAAYMANGRYPEALDVSEKAITMEPDYSVAYETMGYVYLMMGRLDAAKNAYEKAIMIDDNRCFSNLYLAALYSREGKHITAREYYSKAINDSCEVSGELMQELKQLGLQDVNLIK